MTIKCKQLNKIINKAFLIIFIIIIAFSYSCISQKSSYIQLNIIDKDTNGIPFAKITIWSCDTSISKETDINGLLLIKNIKKGEYLLNVSFCGYYDILEYHILLNKKKTQLNIEMQPLNNLSKPVIQY